MEGPGNHETSSRNWLHARCLPLLLAASVGVAVALSVFGWIRYWERCRIEAEFHNAAADRSSIISSGIGEELLALESVGTLYRSPGDLSPREFKELVDSVFSSRPGVEALLWAPRVSNSDRAEFESAARRQGIDGFEISQPDASGGVVSAEGRRQCFPILFAEPRRAREARVGLDLASEPVYAKALLAARDTGKPTATGRIPLPGKSPGQFAFAAVLPVYRQGEPIGTAASRRRNLQGFVVGIFRVADIVMHGLSPLYPQGIDMRVCDGSAPEEQRFLFHYSSRATDPSNSPNPSHAAGEATGPVHDSSFQAGGRRWSVRCIAAPNFVSSRRTWQPWTMLAGGLILTAMLTALMFTSASQKARTERLVRQRTNELRHSEERFRTMAGATQDAIIVMDPRGRISFWNKAATKMFGYSGKEAIGRQLHKLLAPARYREAHQAHFADFQRTGQGAAMGKTLVLQALRKGGQEFPIELSLSAVLLEGCWHAIGVIRDITERKQTEKELQCYTAALESANEALAKLNDEAKAATQAKSRFLANMSHEIRTPLTAILGFADMLCDNLSAPDNIEMVGSIKQSGLHLLELINDILDLSKIEAGKLQVERLRCSPAKIVADVVSLMRAPADKKNLSLDVDYQGAIPETILSDPTRLRQILINLVGNAVKFTEAGGVKLSTRLARDSGKSQLVISVADTGRGMSEDEMARLFQPFVQGETSTNRKYGGTGLGLTISKCLAEALGGHITVSSSPRKGSTFHVSIATGSLEGVLMLEHPTKPIAGSHGPAEPADGSPSRLDCRMLLVEDGIDNQRLLSLILRKAGAEVVLADNGQIACDKVLGGVSGEENAGGGWRDQFDVVLMDMQMPVMDGYEATRRLRGAGYDGLIIALTAHAMKEDRRKCLDAGCDDYVTKPIDRTTLLQTVARRLAERAAAGQQGS